MELLDELRASFPSNQVRARLIDRVAYASDAGFYQLIPKVVVLPKNEDEVKLLFSLSKKYKIPLVFRTGGSSLSGQAITDGILADLSRYWKTIRVEEQGQLVRVEPGITGASVNAQLRRFKSKIGPDPSSIATAMMGGILSNNASGMCCGVRFNAYHTTKFIRFITSNGAVFTTESPQDYNRFLLECPFLAAELEAIRTELIQTPFLYEKVRLKYQTKNTVGYSLNAFLDYEHPLDIFAHLLIGAEGSLAFIAEAVLLTIPDYQYKSTALLYFPSIFDACEAIEPLTKAGAEMVELMDRAALRSVESVKGIDPLLKLLPPGAAALLVEFQDTNAVALQEKITRFLADSIQLNLINTPEFTTDNSTREFLWKVRKGLFPAVGAIRARGTTVILEDIAVPVNKLGIAILDLQQLFRQYGYENGIIFGHAKDGNIHFVITQAFDQPKEIDRYDCFLRDVVNLVVHTYNGTLKAEHGTGRNMAPFIETEWGPEAYQLMQRIKKAADPENLLNPGVIINESPDAHILHMKQLLPIEEEVDKCIECGYCEHVCPSRNLTLTPRQRIVVRRALKEFQVNKEHSNYKTLLKEFQYDGLDTCAVDGLCATACPVDINTGNLVKRLRREQHSRLSNFLALQVAKHFGVVEKLARLAIFGGVLTNRFFGKSSIESLSLLIRKRIPSFPLLPESIVSAPALHSLKNHLKAELPDNKTIVYFHACISRLLGGAVGEKKSLPETFISVANKAGFKVVLDPAIAGSCCSQIFSSKGYYKAYSYTANRMVAKLWQISAEGKFPIVLDVSSCTQTLLQVRPVLTPVNQTCFDRLQILDSIDFLHDKVLPAQPVITKEESVVLHPVCSLQKLGTSHKFISIAEYFSTHVQVPEQAGCCGMAGDRGFFFPELTNAATEKEAEEVKKLTADGYYSSTITCEMAMTKAVNQNYSSILYLADKAML